MTPRFSLLLLLLCSCPPLIAQNGYAISSKLSDVRNQPIEFANIHVNGTLIGTLSDKKGQFELIVPSPQDTVTISAIAYHSQVFTANTLPKLIQLQPKSYTFREVIINSGKPKIIEVGFTGKVKKKKYIGKSWHGLIWNGQDVMNTGAQNAIYIPNESNKVGFIRQLHFYLAPLGKPDAPFRIRLYKKDPDNEQPGEDLLHQTVMIKGDIIDGWVTADLSAHNIELPEDGFFASMEWIQTNNKDFWWEEKWKKIYPNLEVFNSYPKKIVGYGQALGCYNDPKKDAVISNWAGDLNAGWAKHDMKCGLMIKATLKVWE